jgi:hypothetical protein
MRTLSCIALFIPATLLALGAPPAAPPNQPGQLLKPVVPPSSSTRIRIPLMEALGTTMHFKAQIPMGPKGAGKKGEKSAKGEMIDVEVGIENMPGKSYVSAKLWESWGYDIPQSKSAILSEMVVPASLIPTKTTASKTSAKGYDVQVKFPAIALDIVEPPGGSEKVLRCDIYIRWAALTKNADRTFEPRLYFQDRFLELTVPSGSLKRPGTGDEIPPDPAITSDSELVPVACPMTIRGLPVFNYASVNGLTQYKTADGKIELVNVSVSSTTDFPSGVLFTMGTARGCNLEMEQDKDLKATGATFETRSLKGKVKELRLGVATGPGMKITKDIVIKDLSVFIDKSNSGHYVHIGPRFMETYFKDAVYTCGSDGNYQLLGRLNTDLLQDIKTRMKN